MAYATLVMKNSVGEIVKAPVGYSWTFFFFSWIVPLLRKDWKHAGVFFVMAVILAMIDRAALGVVNIVGFIVYNKSYIEEMLRKGFKVDSVIDSTQSVEEIQSKSGLALQ